MKAYFLLEIIAYLVYPASHVNRRVVMDNILLACKDKGSVKYYEMADVYLVRGCVKDLLIKIDGIEKIEDEREYHLAEFELKRIKYEIDTLPWFVKKIHLYDRNQLELSGDGVVCGVLDTGIDTQDFYLAQSFSGYFKDVVNDSINPYDDNGHGTAVSSLIAGEFGVAPNTSLAVCKGFGASGASNDSMILECIEWFYELWKSGVSLRVINNSWGAPDAQYLITVLEKWDSLGIISSFSAGNNGPFYRTVATPSVYPLTFSIGATTVEDTLAWYSSRGPAPDTGIFTNPELWPVPDWNYTKPDFVAPGDYIYVTLPSRNHGIVSGTSFSTPIFTGVLCLIKEAEPLISYREVYGILKNRGVERLSHVYYPDSGYGFGRIDVRKVIEGFLPKVVYDTLSNLSFPSGIEANYEIYTVDGRLIEKGNTPIRSLLLDRPMGLYVIKFFLKEHQYTVKFVKMSFR